jgi:uncharacterized protein (TIRG00374 family)
MAGDERHRAQESVRRAEVAREDQDRSRAQEAAGVLKRGEEATVERVQVLERDFEASSERFFRDRRRMLMLLVAFVLLVVAIYVLFPNVAGLGDTWDRIDQANWYWVGVGVGFNIAAFVAYVALFRGILGGDSGDELHRRIDATASYEITMAGLAATRIFSAAGAGGIALTYWALRKGGMPRRRAACRLVAFNVLLYTWYLLALLIFGVLLRTGVLPGDAPLAGTVVPAAIAGGLLALLGLVALIPRDVERRLADWSRGFRRSRLARRLATVPATLATGVRTAIAYVRHPGRGWLAVLGSAGFWAANIGVLWASFEAFGQDVALGVLVQGFFVGMAANLIPSPAGGVGSVDAGMIGAFLIFGLPTATVFPAVLTYRVIAFWLPIPPGVVAYFQLRRRVSAWESERRGYTSESKVVGRTT